ncbi:MAG: YggT family protein [bacterium]|nr:YggT family protein [bacterium]
MGDDMEEEQRTEVRRETSVDGNATVQRDTVRTNQSVPGSVLGKRIVYYIGGALLLLLAVRFMLLLLGASRSSGFVDFIYGLSGLFVAPFNGIFDEPRYGESVFDSATLVAMVVYAIAMVGIAKLFTLNKRNPEVS